MTSPKDAAPYAAESVVYVAPAGAPKGCTVKVVAPALEDGITKEKGRKQKISLGGEEAMQIAWNTKKIAILS